MEKIDDPLDAVWGQYPEEQENPVGEAALSIVGHVFLPAAIFNSIREQFLIKARKGRVDALLGALKSRLQVIDNEIAENREKLKVVQDKLGSPQFNEAVRVAAEEAARAINEKKIKQLANALVRAVDPERDTESLEDLAGFIRDLARLGDRDIQALQILHLVFADTVKVYPNLHDPNVFTERAAQLLKTVDDSKIHRDDFYSYCKRLEGFGLAIEEPRNTGRMAPGDYCFRPTRRGLKLLALLEECGSAPQTATAG